jgi:hypothetical protein
MSRYLDQGAAGEVKRLLQQESDLPGLAEFKAALDLLDRLDHPSFEERIFPLPTVEHSTQNLTFAVSWS